MAPTAGVLTKAAMVSTDVSIFKPAVVAAVAVTAAFATRVRPVHVTVTAPAARVEPVARVIAMTLEAYKDVVAVCGDKMPHKLTLCPPTTPFKKVSKILLVAAKAVEVVKEMVAIPVFSTA